MMIKTICFHQDVAGFSLTDFAVQQIPEFRNGIIVRMPNHLGDAVMALPDKYRDIVILHYYQSIPTPDVARILRLPQATVRTRLHRARAILQSQLKGWYLNDD